MNSFLQMLMALVVFIPILFLAYVTTRFVGRKSAKAMKGRNINIIETVSLGADKRLHLIKAGRKYLLISSSGKGVEYLTEVVPENEEEIAADVPEETFDFKKLFDRYLQLWGKKNTKSEEESNTEDRNELPFKRNLNRLKTITGTMDGQGQQNGDE